MTGLEETASSKDKGKTELCPDVLGVVTSSGATEDLVASPLVLRAVEREILFMLSQR
jgi:hypothetical protein